MDDITDPLGGSRNKKYGKQHQSSKDARDTQPQRRERDEEDVTVIRTPLETTQGSKDGPREYDYDRRRGSSGYQSYDREVGSFEEKRFRRNQEGGDGFRNRENREDYHRDSARSDQGRFRGRQFDGNRPKMFHSRYNNDESRYRKSDSPYNNDEFRRRNSDSRHRNNYSNEGHVREHRESWYNNIRTRSDPTASGRKYGNTEFLSKEPISRDRDEGLLVVSGDSSLEGEVENVFGIHPVLLALRANKRTIHKIFCKQGIEKTNPKIKEIYQLAADKKIEFASIKGSDLKRVFKGDTVHQGIFCTASPLPVSVLNMDLSQVLPSNSTTSERTEGSAETGDYENLSDKCQEEPHDDQLDEVRGVNSNQNTGNVCDASSSPNVSDQVTLDSDVVPAQPSSNSSVGVEPADFTSSQPATEAIPTSNGDQQSAVATEFDVGKATACLATQALSSAVAIAATKSEQDGNYSSERNACSDPEHPTSVLLSEEWTVGEQSKPQLWLLLDNVTDAMNVGAVLRSCCYFGVSRVLFTPSCADINPVVSKASSGAAELLTLSLVPQPGPTLAALRGRGWKVLVAISREAESHHTPRPLHQYVVTENTILIVGSEGCGISGSISEQADAAVTIPATGPLAGALGCLNVSVAAAITLHALTAEARQNRGDVEAALE